MYESFRYCGGQGSGEEKVESRLGFPTIASGRVTVTLNVVHQVELNSSSPFNVHTMSRQKHFWWGAIQVEVQVVDGTIGSS